MSSSVPTSPASSTASHTSSPSISGVSSSGNSPPFTPIMAGQSPMQFSLFRFLGHQPTTTSTNTNASGSSTAIPSSPAMPVSRGLSDPSSVFSPAQSNALGTLRLQRTRSLDKDIFRLPEPVMTPTTTTGTMSMPSSPAMMPIRKFSVQGGFPAAEAQRRHSNGFLELLCKQDSFMNSD